MSASVVAVAMPDATTNGLSGNIGWLPSLAAGFAALSFSRGVRIVERIFSSPAGNADEAQFAAMSQERQSSGKTAVAINRCVAIIRAHGPGSAIAHMDGQRWARGLLEGRADIWTTQYG
jgi:hypothetical protein